MLSKIKDKEIAISLRRQGFSYSEILEKISVAKSTLSEWLKSIGLSKEQKQKLTEKKRLAALRGSQKRKADRILLTKNIHKEAEKEIGYISKRELWLIGVALYWAEGSKEKEEHIGSGIGFSNSDSRMISLFVKWLKECCLIKNNEFCFEIYIHENNMHRLEQVKNYWSKATGFSIKNFKRIYFKKNKIKTNRKNTGDLYYGLLRVKVNASSSLNRRIAGWVKAICKNCGVV
ncbi:MAG: hypothetical protein WC673_01170 [Candidatus Paceibacterota bacterium]